MKTAKEMAEIAKGSQTYSAQLKNIEKSIEVAAKKGETSCWIYISISDEIREVLTKLGYIVGKQQSDRDGLLTNITWR